MVSPAIVVTLALPPLVAVGSQAPDVFLQYGPLGAITLVLLTATAYVYRRREAQFERQLDQLERWRERESARADELEVALARMNETVRTQITGALHDATRAVTDALGAVRAVEIDQERRRGSGR